MDNMQSYWYVQKQNRSQWFAQLLHEELLVYAITSSYINEREM
jgi:hypothetical protein